MTHTGRAFRISPSGFTLLEIVLALALLAGALAALGEVLRMSRESAEMARDETQAQLLAASLLAELVCQSRPLENVSSASFDLDVDPPWLYSIVLEPTADEGLVAARIRVEQQLPVGQRPAVYELIRWFPDPNLVTAGGTSAAGSSGTSEDF